MATLQKFRAKGHRIFWRLYFPDGTNKEKYKTSRRKTILQELLPDIMRIETLSRRGALTSQDLIQAVNLGILRRDELTPFALAVQDLGIHYLSDLRADYETKSKVASPSMHAHMINLYKGDVLEEAFKDVPISQITPERIEQFRGERKGRVVNITINQDLKALRKYLDIAVSKGYVRENAARKVKLLPEPKNRIPRCLYPDELSIFFKEIKRFRNLLRGEFLFVVRVLIYTGLRRSELLRLRPDDIKLHLRQIHISGKGQKTRVIGINETLMKEFERRVKRGHILRVGIHQSSISRAVKHVFRVLKLSEALTLHSLRHTYISYLLEKGVPTKRVKELAGHFSLSVTDRYTHALPKTAVDEDVLDFELRKV